MFRNPCRRSERASVKTSSVESVTRRSGLSREKPQYLQLLMHSFERYRGAKRRIVLPKRCWLICCERRLNGSNNPAAAGEISAAKSVNARFRLRRLSLATLTLELRARSRNEASGRELN